MRAIARAHAPCKAAPVRRAAPLLPARRPLVVVGFGPGHGGAAPGGTKVLTEKDRGFVAEMRKVAMKLHTKDQSPKEGGKEAPKPGPWTPTREGYLRFLVESKVVYDTLDRIIKSSSNPDLALLRNTGLERSEGLAKDIKWFETKFGLKAPAVTADGPGMTYSRLLEEEAEKDAPAFICHYYNFYFAHTAGGRMIGKQVSGMLLDGQELEFYKWDSDVNDLLEKVRKSLNVMAEHWSEGQKTHCLAETEASFKYSGHIMKCITQTA